VPSDLQIKMTRFSSLKPVRSSEIFHRHFYQASPEARCSGNETSNLALGGILPGGEVVYGVGVCEMNNPFRDAYNGLAMLAVSVCE